MPDETTPRYPIRTVAARTGLTAHVLRAWERRYDVVSPARSGTLRLYSEADVAKLRLLRQLTESGFQISQIASRSRPELLTMLARVPERGATGSRPSKATAASDVECILEAVQTMDPVMVYARLRRAALIHPLRVFAEEIVMPVMDRTGTMWENVDICAVHEHLLSVQVSRVLDWMVDMMQIDKAAPHAIVGVPAGHRHEFGARVACIVAMEEGWNVTFLGNDLPAADIALAARTRNAQAVMLSAVHAGDDTTPLIDEVRALSNELPANTALLVGGSGASRATEALEAAGATYLDSYDALRGMLQAIELAHQAPQLATT